MPWLIALGAQVHLISLDASRSMPLEQLYVDYMKKSMQAEELIEAISVPLPAAPVFQNLQALQAFRL